MTNSRNAGQMCIPWTLSKLLSCRPCFSHYDSPSGVESETLPSAMVAEESNRRLLNRKASGQMGFGRKPIDETSMTTTEKGLPSKDRKYELHWHHGFEDEHFIVLCFGEEESVDQEEDDSDKLEALDKSGNSSEGLNTVNEDSTEDEEEESSVGSTQTESHAKHSELMESGSIGSRYSDQSNGSTGRTSEGSFSFPVLQEAWIGSPVQMPRPKDFYLRKNSGIHVRFPCCKF